MKNSELKVGDSVSTLIWTNLDWKIESIYMSNVKKRARLVAIIGKSYQTHLSGIRIETVEKVAHCSAFLENLKLKPLLVDMLIEALIR